MKRNFAATLAADGTAAEHADAHTAKASRPTPASATKRTRPRCSLKRIRRQCVGVGWSSSSSRSAARPRPATNENQEPAAEMFTEEQVQNMPPFRRIQLRAQGRVKETAGVITPTTTQEEQGLVTNTSATIDESPVRRQLATSSAAKLILSVLDGKVGLGDSARSANSASLASQQSEANVIIKEALERRTPKKTAGLQFTVPPFQFGKQSSAVPKFNFAPANDTLSPTKPSPTSSGKITLDKVAAEHNISPPKPSSMFAPGFAPATTNKWKCSTCLSENADTCTKCACCESDKPSKATVDSSKNLPISKKPTSGSMFAPGFAPVTNNKWKCTTCLSENLDTCIKCACCESDRVASVTAHPAPAVAIDSVGSMFAPGFAPEKTDQWKCSVCLSENDDKNSKCASCDADRPGIGSVSATEVPPSATKRAVGSMFAPGFTPKASNKWKCTDCLSENDDKTTKCACCDADKPKNGAVSAAESARVATKPAIGSMFAPGFVPTSNKWKCNDCLSENEVNAIKCACCDADKPGRGPVLAAKAPPVGAKPPTGSMFAPGFAPTSNKWKCNDCLSENAQSFAKCLCCEADRPASTTSSSSSTAEFKVRTELVKLVDLESIRISTEFKFNLPQSGQQSEPITAYIRTLKADDFVRFDFSISGSKANKSK